MKGLSTLVRRQLRESSWLVLALCLPLAALSFFSVNRARAAERGINSDDARRAMQIQGMLKQIGGPHMDMSSGAIEALSLYWFFVFMPLILVSLWAIARGTAVVWEINRGTIDVILSRPVGRSTYLLSHVITVAVGLAFLGIAIIAGNLLGGLVFQTASPPSVIAQARPVLNLILVGLAIFGYTFFLSSLDQVIWRPLLFSAAITLLQFTALVIGNLRLPNWDDFRWLNKVTLFAAFQPIEAIVRGKLLVPNGLILAGIGLAGIVLAMALFGRRDLPASA